ncbi:MAG TPA: hypothetical protein VD994_11045, partial [Prosthecobacter sp.]|nr:hypothetical protein [Prosthecobacter sp.]
MSAFLHRSFSGPDGAQKSLFQHPRGAQALWLALMTEARGLNLASQSAAEDGLMHLLRQKALDSATVDFFR